MPDKVTAPKISVITVCKNAGATLETCVKSVLSQRYGNLEYIIIDGVSTDSTGEILSKYKDGISKIVSEPDGGIYDAMNKGAKLATGDYIIFINADDKLYDENTMARISRDLDGADFVYGDLINYSLGQNCGTHAAFDNVNEFFLYAVTMPTQATFIRRETFEKYGPHDLKYKICSDYDFFLNALMDGASLKYIRGPISYYCKDGISGNPKSKNIFRRERAEIKAKRFGRMVLTSFLLRFEKSFRGLLRATKTRGLLWKIMSKTFLLESDFRLNKVS